MSGENVQNRIPEETIEEIRQHTDIVDVVSEYVPLKKQGRNFFGLCPFHGEKTPSFSVSPEKQIFHCFGCKIGGNVYSFLMEIEGWSFLEAVQHLAEKANIELPQITLDTKRNGQSKQQEMLEMHNLLVKLYHYCLMETGYGKEALAYLKSRGIHEQTIKMFQIGYSPQSWDFSTNFLIRRGFSLDVAEAAGLIAKRSFDGKRFDRFRHRIMFPIQNAKGETIAFGGRIIHDGEPKYLNSPETLIFNKSSILYGFHLAREHIRKKRQAVLFEGYVDVISAWGAGVLNAIATLGTALTSEQANRIRHSSESVIICYDSDSAGMNATLKAAELLERVGCLVKVANLPDGYDPDDYIQKYGGKKFRDDVLAQSLTVMSFKMKVMRANKNLFDEGERLKYIEDVLKEVSKLPNAIERDHYVRQIADEFSLSLDALKNQLRFLRSQRLKDEETRLREGQLGNSLVKNKLLPAYQNAERMLLSHMMNNRDIALQVKDKLGGSFNIEIHSALAAYIYAFYSEHQTSNIRMLLNTIDDQDILQLASELAIIDINEQINEEALNDYIREIENYPKWKKIKEKTQEKIAAEQREDFITAAQIANEIIEMKKSLKLNK